MNRNFKEAVAHRRSLYALGSQTAVSPQALKEIVDFAVLNTPSAFNSQSARVVLLLGENHKKLWHIVKAALARATTPEKLTAAVEKIDASFLSGYGTILFFEDQDVVRSLQQTYATYSDNFPLWSLQSSGMLQLVVWTMLEDAGLGATLQHYNPLIDADVARAWAVPPSWKLMSQMPFGAPLAPAGEKKQEPLETRVLVFE